MLQYIFKVQSAISEYANLSVSCELKPFLLCGLCRDWFTSCKWLGTSRRVGIAVGNIRCPDRHSTAWCPSSVKHHSVDPGLGVPSAAAFCTEDTDVARSAAPVWDPYAAEFSRLQPTASCSLSAGPVVGYGFDGARSGVSALCGQEVDYSAVQISAIVRWTSDKWGTVSRSAMRTFCWIKPISVSGF